MKNIFRKTGMPESLGWGYLGVLIFMMGDGIEQTWLSRYITDAGFNAAELFSLYGIMVALSSWLSGVIAETWGVKRTMLAGFILYCLGVAGFAGIGMANMNFPVLLLTYAIKGLGYPLFAYTFMVWITYRTEKSVLSSAQGWFWFVFTGGLNVLGAYYGVFAVRHFGVLPTLWSALLFAFIGAAFALWINKSASTNLYAGDEEPTGGIRGLIRGLGIMKREPKVLLGGIVRVINTGDPSSSSTSSSTWFSESSATRSAGTVPSPGSAA